MDHGEPACALVCMTTAKSFNAQGQVTKVRHPTRPDGRTPLPPLPLSSFPLVGGPARPGAAARALAGGAAGVHRTRKRHP